jgi:DNA-binding transcriptional ArsR family regulator
LAAVDGAGDRTQDLLVALSHPIRRRILREMDGEPPTSPRQMTELLGESLSNVSYHFRVLAGAGVLRLVSTRSVRGSTQHFYDAWIDAEWARALLAGEDGGAGNGDRRGEEIA